MKNWKYIQVGNDATADKLGLKPAPFNPNQLNPEDEKKVKDLFQKNGGDYEKTIKDIKAEYKSLPEDGIRRMLYNLVGVPQKAKNESIYKQEASMFGGLGKKAKEEIGNESQDVEKMARLRQLVSGDIIKTKDGKVEIEKYDEIGFLGRDGKRYTWSEVKAYNSKTGNAFDFETQAVVDRKEAVKRAEEELRKAEAERNKHRGEMYWEEAYITAKKDLERAKENLERAKRQKTGNAEPKYELRHPTGKYAEVWDDGSVVIFTKDGAKEIQQSYKNVAEAQKMLHARGFNSKTGNARYGSDEDVLSHLDTDLYEIHQRLKQKDESPWRYLSELQKKGYDMGTLSRHNKDIGKIIEKLKTGNETKEAEKVDNAQWSRSYYKEKIDPAKWSEFEREFDKLNQRHIEEKTLAEQDGKRPDFEKQQREAEMVVKKYALNNLKRARNAMAKNSQVTLWNGNDTVLISEDGTVQYLESNSFEVGKDKYDSQQMAIEEMTKKGYRKK